MTDNNLGNCQYSKTSSDCAHNSYCPLPNFKDNSWCTACNLDMVLGYSCNCETNFRKDCAECNGPVCFKCIRGMSLVNGLCQPSAGSCQSTNSTSDPDYNCPNNSFCPEGQGERQCQTCKNIPNSSKCNCAGTLIENCMMCFQNTCSQCRQGSYLVYGLCQLTNDFGNCSKPADCQNGTFCNTGQQKCTPCSKVNNTNNQCNCNGILIGGCTVCDFQTGCRTCMRDSKGQYTYAVTNGKGKCDTPMNCNVVSDPSSHKCHYGYQCNTEKGNVCESCENSIYESVFCYCTKARKILACAGCNGQVCNKCLYGFILKETQTGTNCLPNYCTVEVNRCQNSYACPQNPLGTTPCHECYIGQKTPCNCYYQENCETCNDKTQKCKTCLLGFQFEGEYCKPRNNICSQNGSYSCNSGYSCLGESGEDCQLCDLITSEKYCNCSGNLIKNCKKCNNNNCEICITGYVAVSGQCQPNMCGPNLNTQNCQFGYFCPNNSTNETELCQKCGTQSQECNCGFLLGCQTCGEVQNTCGDCFHGYKPNQDKQCVLDSNICDFQGGSTLCLSGYYCKGNFGDPCISCSQIENLQFCKCESDLIKNCKECDGNKCTECIVGFYPLNGVCIQNICIAGGTANTCAISNFCPKIGSGTISCNMCPSQFNDPCNCGADFCKTCGPTNNSCGSCLQGYRLDPSNQCKMKTNICNQISSSILCSTGYFCNGVFGDDCVSCQHVTEDQSCNCEKQFVPNCVQCNGAKCAKCLPGYLISENGTCVLNRCDENLKQTTCSSGFQCPTGSKKGDECQPCNESLLTTCNCGTAQNCKTCGKLNNTCQHCIKGYYLQISTQTCIPIDDNTPNICDKDDKSTRCNNQYACTSIYGENCVACSQIQPEKDCNCDGTLRNSCLLCSNDKKCKICLKGYYLDQYGDCKLNSCSATAPCSDGFYCPIGAAESNCVACTTLSTTQCVCGSAQNCQTCSNLPNQCFTCLEGFQLSAGKCIPSVTCEKNTDCSNNQYCDASAVCSTCSNYQEPLCNCGLININCQACPNSICQSCIDGYIFDSNKICSIPICNGTVPEYSYCSGPNETNKCPSDLDQIEFMDSPCNCGDSQDCAFCDVLNKCKICMPGFVLVNEQCYEDTPDFTGVCVSAPNSKFCTEGNSCIIPSFCSDCISVSEGYFCKCGDQQILNCVNCEEGKCTECINGFTLLDNTCVTTCFGSETCEVGQFCYNSACITCDGSELCNCGSNKNCLKCDDGKCSQCLENFQLYRDKCDNCIVGFEETDGKCTKIDSTVDKNTFVVNVIFMVIAGVSVVGAVIGIIVFYKKRPKKYSFQHRVM